MAGQITLASSSPHVRYPLLDTQAHGCLLKTDYRPSQLLQIHARVNWSGTGQNHCFSCCIITILDSWQKREESSLCWPAPQHHLLPVSLIGISWLLQPFDSTMSQEDLVRVWPCAGSAESWWWTEGFGWLRYVVDLVLPTSVNIEPEVRESKPRALIMESYGARSFELIIWSQRRTYIERTHLRCKCGVRLEPIVIHS